MFACWESRKAAPAQSRGSPPAAPGLLHRAEGCSNFASVDAETPGVEDRSPRLGGVGLSC